MINVLIHVSDQNTLNQMLKSLGITRYTVDTKKENLIEFDLDLPCNQKESRRVDPQVKRLEQAEKSVGTVTGQRTKICPLCKTEFVPHGKQKYCDDCKKQYGEQVSRELRRRQALNQSGD